MTAFGEQMPLARPFSRRLARACKQTHVFGLASRAHFVRCPEISIIPNKPKIIKLILSLSFPLTHQKHSKEIIKQDIRSKQESEGCATKKMPNSSQCWVLSWWRKSWQSVVWLRNVPF